MPTSQGMREVFDCSVAGLAGPVVARRVRRGVQQGDVVGSQEVAGLLGNEGGAVVGFEQERSAMLGDQRPENVDGRYCIRRGDRVRGERATRGEIPDGQDVPELPVDRRGRLGVIERPGPSRTIPGHAAVEAACRHRVDFGPGEMEQALYIASRQTREVVLQHAHPESRAVEGKEIENVPPFDRRARQRAGSQRDQRETIRGIVPPTSPLRQGSRRQTQGGSTPIARPSVPSGPMDAGQSPFANRTFLGSVCDLPTCSAEEGAWAGSIGGAGDIPKDRRMLLTPAHLRRSQGMLVRVPVLVRVRTKISVYACGFF
jgi:hypothetical protein